MRLLFRLLGVLSIVATVLALVAYSVWDYLNPSPPSQQLLINATVLTMDKTNTIAEAVLLEDDRILATGSQDVLEEMAEFNVDVIDLEGMTLVPGFIEAHGHFPGSGLDAISADLNSPPLGDTLSVSDVIKKLKSQASKLEEGEWITGFGFDDTMILEKRFLTRDDLDQVSTEHPVFVMHISGHMSMVNSLVLNQMGISEQTPNPDGGEIVRDKQGRPTGLLKETAQDPVRDQAMNPSLSSFLDLLANGVEDYLIQGVTTVQSGLAPPEQLMPMGVLATLGIIPQRLVFWPDEELAEALQTGEAEVINNEKVTTGALKLITDGSIQGYTGFLTTPYHKKSKDKPSEYQGYPTMKQEELNQLVATWHSRGWQLALHANGDAAIDQVIQAIELAQSNHPRSDARHIIVHAQTARIDQLEKMAQLGITPSFFPSHIYYWGDRHHSIFLGEERASQISPLKSATEAGVRYTIHTDTPVVPIEPLRLISNAVERKTLKGKVLGEEEKISVTQALRATTIDAAWQIFREDDLGSIEPGKLADFAVLSDNPLDHPERIDELQVVQTWIGGVKRYDSGELSFEDE